jgi:hypothetical protein
MVTQLPPLEPGETEVTTFQTLAAGPGPAPSPAAALVSTKTEVHRGVSKSTMRVNITTMGKDRSLQRGQMELELASMDDMQATTVSWTRSVTTMNGKVNEQETSCEDGKFQCNGDAAWCNEQKEIVCQVEDAGHRHELAFMQRRSRLQSLMQA